MKKKSNKHIKKYYIPANYNIYGNCTVLTNTHMLCTIVTNKGVNFTLPDTHCNYELPYSIRLKLIAHEVYVGYSYYIYDVKATFTDDKMTLTEEIVNDICTTIFGLRQ